CREDSVASQRHLAACRFLSNAREEVRLEPNLVEWVSFQKRLIGSPKIWLATPQFRQHPKPDDRRDRLSAARQLNLDAGLCLVHDPRQAAARFDDGIPVRHTINVHIDVHLCKTSQLAVLGVLSSLQSAS